MRNFALTKHYKIITMKKSIKQFRRKFILIGTVLFFYFGTVNASTVPTATTASLPGSVELGNIKEYSGCQIHANPLFDYASSDGFIAFDVKPNITGTYTFTANLATGTGLSRYATLGPVDASGKFLPGAIEQEIPAGTNSSDWTVNTADYFWTFDLTINTVYTFKLAYRKNGQSYGINAYTINATTDATTVEIGSVHVNNILIIPRNNTLSTDAYYNEDLKVSFTPISPSATVTYTAKCNDVDLAISSTGLISKSAYTNGDIVKVSANITDGATIADYTVTINMNDVNKKLIRGTSENDGTWTTVNTSAVQSWTDYVYSVSPNSSSTKFSNGSWVTSAGNAIYGFQANNSTDTISFPSNFKVSAVSIIGYGAATLNLNSAGATVTPPAPTAFSDNSSASQPEEVKFTLENHTPGSPLILNVSNTDCRFFIVLNYQKEIDATAPQLIYQNIVENANDQNVHGIITLRFNEAIKLSESATALLDSKEIDLKLENNVFLNYTYWSISYSTKHTFVIKANSIEDIYGNKIDSDISINFYTKDKTQVSKKVYDFVVGVDGTIDEAIVAANKAPGKNRYYIFVPDGSYELSGNSADHMTSLTRSNVSIIGQSMSNSVITNTPASSGISYTATIELKSSHNTYMQDICLKNNKGEAGAGVEVALFNRYASQCIFKNVKLYSYQDTYVTGDRCYHEDCEIYGGVDYICGGGNNFFENCMMYNRGASGNKVTAPGTTSEQMWGYVFNNCTIKGGQFVLGRPWQGEPRAYYLNTKMNIPPTNPGWEGMSSLMTHFYEYQSTDTLGNLLSLTGRGNSPSSLNTYVPILTDSAAAEFTMYNVLESAKDGWVPTDYTNKIEAQALSLADKNLSWGNDPEAMCAIIFKDGKYFGSTIENSYMLTQNGEFTVRLANSMGGLGALSNSITYEGATSIEHYEKDNIIAYPNPAQDNITIDTPGLNNVIISIIDLDGRILFSKSTNSNPTSLNIGYLKPGLYTIKLKSDSAIYTKSFIKK